MLVCKSVKYPCTDVDFKRPFAPVHLRKHQVPDNNIAGRCAQWLSPINKYPTDGPTTEWLSSCCSQDSHKMFPKLREVRGNRSSAFCCTKHLTIHGHSYTRHPQVAMVVFANQS